MSGHKWQTWSSLQTRSSVIGCVCSQEEKGGAEKGSSSESDEESSSESDSEVSEWV